MHPLAPPWVGTYFRNALLLRPLNPTHKVTFYRLVTKFLIWNDCCWLLWQWHMKFSHLFIMVRSCWCCFIATSICWPADSLPRSALASFSVTGILERPYPFRLSAKSSGGNSCAVYLLVKWDLIEFAPTAHQGSMQTHEWEVRMQWMHDLIQLSYIKVGELGSHQTTSDVTAAWA